MNLSISFLSPLPLKNEWILQTFIVANIVLDEPLNNNKTISFSTRTEFERKNGNSIHCAQCFIHWKYVVLKYYTSFDFINLRIFFCVKKRRRKQKKKSEIGFYDRSSRFCADFIGIPFSIFFKHLSVYLFLSRALTLSLSLFIYTWHALVWFHFHHQHREKKMGVVVMMMI